LAKTTSSCVKIGSVVFAVGDDKNKKGRGGKEREGEGRKGKENLTESLYFTYL